MNTILQHAPESLFAELFDAGKLMNGRTEQSGADVFVRPLSMLSPDDIAAWKRLAGRAAEPNPFQEPEFVLPLAEHVLRDDDIRILSVADCDSGEWIAACAVQACAPSLSRPLPHLRALQSAYSFLDSPLIDRQQLSRATRSALAYLRHQRMWHGIRFRVQNPNTPQMAILTRQALAFDLAIDTDHHWTRAVTDLRDVRETPLIDRCSKSRRKSLQRARRTLEKAGPVSHRLVTGDDAQRACAEFLRLEALGWKGAEGTAIACLPDDRSFFEAMVRGFAATGQVLFGELLVGERVIASTCNLVAGSHVFALKLGWDPEFAGGNPGHWAEIELATALARQRPDLTLIDSCSQPGSYVESVATGRIEMASVVLVWSRRASALCEVRRQLRFFRSGWTADSPSPATAVEND